MSVNYVVIHNVSDFKTIIDTPIVFPENEIEANEIILENMWWITLDSPTVGLKELIEFVNKFLKSKQNEIIQQKKVVSPARFYMWFDEMAVQLRCNIIFGSGKLPFGCKIQEVNSAQVIIEEFIKSLYRYGISWSEITQAAEFDDDENEDSFVLKVFVSYLYPIENRDAMLKK